MQRLQKSHKGYEKTNRKQFIGQFISGDRKAEEHWAYPTDILHIYPSNQKATD